VLKRGAVGTRFDVRPHKKIKISSRFQVGCERSDGGLFLGMVPSGEASSGGGVGRQNSEQKCHRNKGRLTAVAAFRNG
jgi:hypothetical protein